jgi:hypothetical protein
VRETWFLIGEHILRVFESRVRRRIFGPKREDGENCIVKRLVILILW